MVYLSPLDRLRLERGATHLHTLGARATAELLAEIGHRAGCMPDILYLLSAYQQRLSPLLLRAVGGDRFPRHPLRVVPPRLPCEIMP
jgi:hypothetical protein